MKIRYYAAVGLIGMFSSVSACAAERWIVVTAPALRDAIEPLKQHREKEGFTVTVVATTDVLSGAEIAKRDAAKLRDKVRGLCDGKEKAYVLLVGATGAATNKEAEASVVPTLIGTVSRMKGELSDNGYGCLAEGMLPEVAVGRLPARTREEARAMVDKILKFERDGQQELWRRQIALLVGNPGGNSAAEQTVANSLVSGACRTAIDKMHPTWNLRAIYHIPGSPWYVPDDKLYEVTTASLERGAAFTCYLGHSNHEGFSSERARFFSRENWVALKGAQSGVFVTCGCYACQLDPKGQGENEGYALAAVRNPAGPVAAIGATAESYAAAGQLAFDGVVGEFAKRELPERLGDLYLKMKAGIAKGPIDVLTFTMFDYGDGSNGRIPLEVQRREHLEMWMLLGDPALRFPALPGEIAIEAKVATRGQPLAIRAKLPKSGKATVRVTVERPAIGLPADLETVPDGPPEARARALSANHARADNPVICEVAAEIGGGVVEVQPDLPAKLPWPEVIVRISARQGDEAALGVVRVKVEQPK